MRELDKTGFGGAIRGSWRGALSAEKAPEVVDVFIKPRPWYFSKRFIGSTLYVIGWAVKLKSPELGEFITKIGGAIAGLGVAHAAIKSSPVYGGKAGKVYQLVNGLTSKK